MGVIQFEIQGVSPILLHNGAMADPMSKYAKELKAVSSKRKKTDEDFAAMSQIEFRGGLYTNEDGRVVLPSEMIERCIVEGAKKSKLGKAALAGLYIDNDPLLIYDGPKSVDELWSDGRYRDTRGVRVGTAKIMRTRPKFATWGLKFAVNYLADVLDREQIIEAVTQAGRLVGLGDYRPRYGRFDIAEVSDIAEKGYKVAA